jgi:hypothetical protein
LARNPSSLPSRHAARRVHSFTLRTQYSVLIPASSAFSAVHSPVATSLAPPRLGEQSVFPPQPPRGAPGAFLHSSYSVLRTHPRVLSVLRGPLSRRHLLSASAPWREIRLSFLSRNAARHDSPGRSEAQSWEEIPLSSKSPARARYPFAPPGQPFLQPRVTPGVTRKLHPHSPAQRAKISFVSLQRYSSPHPSPLRTPYSSPPHPPQSPLPQPSP